MEEIQAARRSSGIYHANYDSNQSLNSDAHLRGISPYCIGDDILLTLATEHAAAPAGVGTASTVEHPAGGPTTYNTPSGWNDTADQPPATTPASAVPHVPFYKKRKFIISQIIIIPLGIALLFILLFPVVRAIAELILKRATLDIQGAVITRPVNNS